MTGTTLAGRAVVVFGAAGALGTGLAAAFAGAGASVVGADRTVPSGGRAVDGVRYHPVDVTDDGAVAELLGNGPPPWAVINTVGGFAPHAPLTELDTGVLNAQLKLNLVSAAVITKHVL